MLKDTARTPRRPGWIAALGGLLLAATIVNPAGAAVGDPLKPDVRAKDSGPVRICQEAVNPAHRCSGTGRVVLRTSTYMENIGKGPLEYVPVSPAQDIPTDCHGDGNVDLNGDGIPDDNDVIIRQRIYKDADGNGAFNRSVDTGHSDSDIGCRYYHAEHDHYHVESFAQLLLRRESTGQIIRTGNKISFCVADTNSFGLGLPGTPTSPFYSEGGCANRLSTQGISVGWSDLYGWHLPGQDIDITGIPSDTYCLIVRADPNDLLDETVENNQDRYFRTTINPSTAPVNGYLDLRRASGSCAPLDPPPPPPPPPPPGNPLKPDLQVPDRGPVRLCQETSSGPPQQPACKGTGRTVIRASSYVENIGRGPLEYIAATSAQDLPADCRGDGNPDITGDGVPDDNDVIVRQRIYQDANADSVFNRSVDTAFTESNIGCRYFHPAHNRNYVEGLSRFYLRSEQTGQVVRTGNKLSFCVADVGFFSLAVPGAPQSAFYPDNGCPDRNARQGTSVSWYDLDPWSHPGQEVNVTGLPAGTYCLIVRADPNDVIDEANETNNDRLFRTFINPGAAPVNTFQNLQRASGTCAPLA